MPLEGFVNWLNVRASLSGSESLVDASPLTGVSSKVETESFTASGAGFTTFQVNVSVTIPPFPSLAVIVVV